MEVKKVNAAEILNGIREFWKLYDVADFNKQKIQVIKIKGDYEMHSHPTDKCFLVVEGQLIVEFEDGTYQTVDTCEFIIIPKNIPHKPRALVSTTLFFLAPIE